MHLRIHSQLLRSRSNGPGIRAVLWVQGCKLSCPGCFNPGTHDPVAGRSVSVQSLASEFLAVQDTIQGITISGGEPLDQQESLCEFTKLIRKHSNLSVILFTGYSLLEARQNQRLASPGRGVLEELLTHVDVLIAGRFMAGKRLASGLRGSSNKAIHFLTDRYSEKDFESIPDAEIILGLDGAVTMSGIDPLNWAIG